MLCLVTMASLESRTVEREPVGRDVSFETGFVTFLSHLSAAVLDATPYINIDVANGDCTIQK